MGLPMKGLGCNVSSPPLAKGLGLEGLGIQGIQGLEIKGLRD